MSETQCQVRVTSPFLAVRRDYFEGRSRFVKLREGNVISTPEEFEDPGLLAVTQGGEPLLVFGVDLRERTEPIGESGGTFGE